AYRDNEVNSSHPLFKLISNIKDKKWSCKEIKLEFLKSQYCHEMVSYILDSPLSETEELSKFINNLSEGNPLFLCEILFYLHNENLIYLDVNRYWKWNLDQIRESNMPSTVVAFFSSKVKMLPLATIDLLEYCACMGNRFSPTEISLVKEISLSKVFEILKLALALGLLMETKDEFQFVHDRVQESVLNEIDANRRRRIHWKIGTHFLKPVGTDIDFEKNNDIFSIATHLNLGKPSEIDQETTYTLARINYHAGKKALMSLATTAANEYFRMARNILLKDSWNSHYEVSFKIYQKSAKTELMCGNYATSEKLLNLLLENAKSDLDKTECLAEQTTSFSSIGNFIKAIETANRGLSYFGKTIPIDSKDADKKREQLMNDIESKDLDVWSIISNMPFTKERKSKIELSFYSELIPDLYMSGLVPQLYLSAVMSTLHCLSGGMDESVIYSFAIMALYHGEKGEFDKAFKYEDLAQNLSEKYPN
ncbi:MAG: phytochrome sensor protein, partial [Candidatus Omnitrophica bacterium]|nr:phytochrome sensor protein [Candidatus Omnitrophota bacterium]